MLSYNLAEVKVYVLSTVFKATILDFRLPVTSGRKQYSIIGRPAPKIWIAVGILFLADVELKIH